MLNMYIVLLGLLICLFLIMKTRLGYLRLTSILMALFLGLRDYGGIDDNSYIQHFKMSIGGIQPLGVEKSFYYISNIVNNLGWNYKGVFIIYALGTFFFIYLFLREFTKSKLEVLIYYLAYLALVFIPNVTLMRQMFASAIIMYAMISFDKKNYFNWVLLISFAVLVHQSSYIIFILYPLLRALENKNFLICLPIFGFIMGYTKLTNYLYIAFFYLIPKRYQSYLLFENINNISFLQTVLFILFIYVIFVMKDKITSNDLNIVRFISIYFFLFFMFSQSGWLGRISYHFILFLPLLFVILIRYKSSLNKVIFSYFSILFLITLFLVSIYITKENNSYQLVPYKLSLNIGVNR